ncbi:acyltransferase [Rahnella sp. AA]|uniref:acyltransferase family protein n=1 Tax=Rahnella sp. AA TaxID=2057180 RepID=UPI000C32CE6B|nr:acyltransferase family protein [Rahnella sp. AA]PKE28767.1 acyltransferase [Rahnella sp. AA]
MVFSLQDKTSPKFYRRDIDGLRAIAIILVVIFHSGLSLFPSGFIGVDIFFVISGYLITNIITSDIDKDAFSIKEFYRRRLWRIQPALICMWFFVFIFATLIYLPDDYIKYFHSQKYSSLLLANQFFSRQSTEYASPDSAIFPLLHTWSLAIEWQWYLLLPVILISAKKLRPKTSLAVVVNTLFVCALCASFIMVFLNLPGKYYSLSARMYEFLAGGAVIFLERKYKDNFNNIILNNIISLLAIITLIGVALSQGVLNNYPNNYALVVVLSTCVLLFSGGFNQETISTKGLRSAPAAYMGKISYSLYLWHWPVFAINNYIYGSVDVTRVIVCLCITWVLSVMTYSLVETPLRRKTMSFTRTLAILIILPVICSIVANKLVDNHQGYSLRLGHSYDDAFKLQQVYSQKAHNRPGCLDGKQIPSECEFGDLKSGKTALMIGDSTSNQFWGFWDVMGQNAHVKITALSTPSCLSLPGIYQFDWWIYKSQTYDKCYENTRRYYELIKKQHYDYVIIGEIWEQYSRGPWLINSPEDPRSQALSEARMETAMRAALNAVTASGGKPIIMRTIAPMPDGYMACRDKEAVLRHPFNKQACDANPSGSSEDDWILGLFRKMSESYPTLTSIDPKKIQCPDGRCLTELGGIGIYRDVGHITDYASYTFGERYLSQEGNPLK